MGTYLSPFCKLAIGLVGISQRLGFGVDSHSCGLSRRYGGGHCHLRLLVQGNGEYRASAQFELGSGSGAGSMQRGDGAATGNSRSRPGVGD
jgi:hypothetical protein